MPELCSSPRLQLSFYPPEDEGMMIFTVCGPVPHKPNSGFWVQKWSFDAFNKTSTNKTIEIPSEPVRETFTGAAYLTKRALAVTGHESTSINLAII